MSASRFHFVSTPSSSNGYPARSALKWTSQSNNPPKANSTPIVAFQGPSSSMSAAVSFPYSGTSWKSKTTFSTQRQLKPNFPKDRNQLIKIVDSKRIRTVPVSSRHVVRQHSTSVTNARQNMPAPNALWPNPPQVWCDHRPVKAFEVQSLTRPKPVSNSPIPLTTYKKISTTSGRISTNSPKKLVSQYKLVRETAFPPRTTRQKKLISPSSDSSLASGNRLIMTNIISKYKLRRRVASESSPITKRLGNRTISSSFFGRNFVHRRGVINRFKIVRKPSWKTDNKKLYKIDRRHKKFGMTKASYRSSSFHVTKYRWKAHSRSKIFGKKKVNYQLSQRHCLFYIRYGRCCRGLSCPLIHDPMKVAVCTRFLRGTCNVRDCPFSHVLSPDKMPLCRYYLLGNCIRPDCPYLHVNHGGSVQNCVDFQRGFCPRGAKCDKKHNARNRTRVEPRSKSSHQFSAKEAVAKECNKFGSLISTMLRNKFATHSRKQHVIDLSMGPLPEFVPLVKDDH